MFDFGIGVPVPRFEDDRLVCGRGSYVDDVAPADQTVMYVIRSPYAAADIKSVDLSQVRAAPGVIDAFSFADIAERGIRIIGSKVPYTRADGSPYLQTPYLPLAEARAAYAGDAVAVVVAETLDQAKDAAELADVEYEIREPVIDARHALREGAAPTWPDHPDNACFEHRLGDAEAADAVFARARHVVTETFRQSRVATVSMEARAAIGAFDLHSRRYRLRAGLQMPHESRNDIAAALGIPASDLHVISPDVGGGFGMKLAVYQEYILVLIAAERSGRAVRWFGERSESFQSDQQARDTYSEVSLALDADGQFLALRVRNLANLGAYVGQWSLHVPGGNLGGLAGVYRIGAFDVRTTGVLTNTVPVGPYRGAGRPEATYSIERIIDKAARVLEVDPVELRRRNMITPGEMPYDTGLVFTYDCGDFPAVLDGALKASDWNGFSVRLKNSESIGKLRGRGLAYSIESAGGPAGRAFDEFLEIRFDASGRATILAGSHSHGQGHETAYRQIASHRLGLKPEEVRIVFGDTDRVAHGRGSFGSRTMMAGGAAFNEAAAKVIHKATAIAAHMLEVPADSVSFSEGVFAVDGSNRTATLPEVARFSFQTFSLPVDIEPGLWASSASSGGGLSFPNACHVCEVEIDPATGETQIVRYFVVEDVGTVINPLLLEGQMQGGIAQGIGQALMEEIVFDPDSGQLLTGSFMDYAMPRAEHICPAVMQSHPVPTKLNPLGAKGAGEAGTVGALSAVMNAVGDALARQGIEHFDMPATPLRVWSALNNKE